MVVEKPASTSAAELAAARLLVESAQQDRSKFADLYDKYFYLVYAYTAPRSGPRHCRRSHFRSFSESAGVFAEIDAWHRRAIAGGATEIDEPKDQAYGDRVSAVSDPFGNTWYLATHMAEPDH